jgi:hypothetical protein
MRRSVLISFKRSSMPSLHRKISEYGQDAQPRTPQLSAIAPPCLTPPPFSSTCGPASHRPAAAARAWLQLPPPCTAVVALAGAPHVIPPPRSLSRPPAARYHSAGTKELCCTELLGAQGDVPRCCCASDVSAHGFTFERQQRRR